MHAKNPLLEKKKIVRLFRDGIPIMILSNSYQDKALLAMVVGNLLGCKGFTRLLIEIEEKEE